jgi:hypothetical protein
MLVQAAPKVLRKMIVKDREVSYVSGIQSQTDWLKALSLATCTCLLSEMKTLSPFWVVVECSCFHRFINTSALCRGLMWSQSKVTVKNFYGYFKHWWNSASLILQYLSIFTSSSRRREHPKIFGFSLRKACSILQLSRVRPFQHIPPQNQT